MENKKSSKGKITAIAVLAIAVIAAGLIFLPKLLNRPNSQKVLSEDAMLFEIAPEKEVTKGQLDETAKIIGERVKEFGDSYSIDADEDKISLHIAEGILPNNADVQEYVLNTLTAKGNLSVISSSDYRDFVSEDIESIDVETETAINFYDLFGDYIDKHKSDDFGKNYYALSDDDELYYIRVRLTGEGTDKLAELAGGSGSETLAAVLDYEYGAHTSSGKKIGNIHISAEQDNSEFIILIPYLDSKSLDNMVKNIITNDKLPESFAWQFKDTVKYESGESVTGKYQKEAIGGNALEIKCDIYYGNANPDDNLAETFANNLKDKLDILKSDYAIGYTGLGGRTVVARVKPESMGSQFVRLLEREGRISLSTPLTDIAESVDNLELAKDDDGNNCFKTEFKLSSYVTGYNTSIKDVPDGEKIYLRVNNVTIASAEKPPIDENTKDITLNFSNLLIINEDSISDSNLKAAEFIIKCAQSGADRITVSSIGAKYCDENGEETDDDIPWGYDCETEIDKATIEKIESVYPNAKARVLITYENGLAVTLDIPVDDNLPAEFTSAVKEIYTKCGLGDGTYRNIYFFIKDESAKNPVDRCRMGYNKTTSNSVGFMKGFCVINGPTFEKYEEEFNNIIAADELFSSQQWMS